MGKNDLERTAAKHSQNLAEMIKKKTLLVPTSINPATTTSVVPVPAVENPVTCTPTVTVIQNPVTSTPAVPVVKNQVASASELSASESGKKVH